MSSQSNKPVQVPGFTSRHHKHDIPRHAARNKITHVKHFSISDIDIVVDVALILEGFGLDPNPAWFLIGWICIPTLPVLVLVRRNVVGMSSGEDSLRLHILPQRYSLNIVGGG